MNTFIIDKAHSTPLSARSLLVRSCHAELASVKIPCPFLYHPKTRYPLFERLSSEVHWLVPLQLFLINFESNHSQAVLDLHDC